jgi:hypothetical protein
MAVVRRRLARVGVILTVLVLLEAPEPVRARSATS